MTTPEEDPLLTAQETADYLRMPLASLYQLNHKGTGPRRIPVGRQVLYRKSDIDLWLDAQAIPTKETA